MGRASCLRICSTRTCLLSFFRSVNCFFLFFFFSSRVFSKISMTALSLGRPSAFLLRMHKRFMGTIKYRFAFFVNTKTELKPKSCKHFTIEIADAPLLSQPVCHSPFGMGVPTGIFFIGTQIIAHFDHGKHSAHFNIAERPLAHHHR